MQRLPRDPRDDYSPEAAESRRRVVSDATGASLEHLAAFSFDPEILPGNMEGFAGVAQVPVGFAGPMLVDGEHAHGEYFVPMPQQRDPRRELQPGHAAHPRGGGITTTVLDDAMQRAPIFVFDDARAARDFGSW